MKAAPTSSVMSTINVSPPGITLCCSGAQNWSVGYESTTTLSHFDLKMRERTLAVSFPCAILAEEVVDQCKFQNGAKTSEQ